MEKIEDSNVVQKTEESEKENSPMTTENLERLLKEITPEETVFSESDLDLPIEEPQTTPQEAAVEVVEDVVSEVVPQMSIVKITSLEKWFEKNSSNINNINQVKVSIRGIDSKQTLIMAVKDPSGGKDAEGNDKRVLKVFDNADTIPVLDVTPLAMDIYNNGFRVIHQFSDTIFIKAYGIKTGLICSLCVEFNGKLIPYNIIKLKRKDLELPIPCDTYTLNNEKMQAQASLETVQLLYKQSAKALAKFTTNQSVVEWLIDRQKDISDINHHLQIDDVIINILK